MFFFTIGYPMSHQYPYLPAMVAQYYGYPYPGPQAYSVSPIRDNTQCYFLTASTVKAHR